MRIRLAFIALAVIALTPGFASGQDIASPSAPLSDCTDSDFCRYSIDFTSQEASYRLGDKDLTYWVEGGLIRIAARSDKPEVSLCCTFQAAMTPVGGDGGGKIWGAVYHVPALDQSVISISVAAASKEVLTWRGPHAPLSPERVYDLQGQVTEIDFDSRHLKEKRKLYIYTPKVPPPATGYPVIYLADGISVKGYAQFVDKLIADGRIRPVLLVGMANGAGPRLSAGGYDQRSREYLPKPGAIPQDYLNHEAFVLEEVMPLAEDTYHASKRPEDRMTSGFSSGATWALSFALRHRDTVSKVAAFSIGMPDNHFDFTGNGLLDLYFEAGRFEPPFLKRTEAACRKAIEAGIRCGMMKLYAGHDAEAWSYAFAETLKVVYPAEP